MANGGGAAGGSLEVILYDGYDRGESGVGLMYAGYYD